MGGGFEPFRVDVDWLPCHEAPIKPLIAQLSFIRDAAHWGAAFRFGHLEVPERTSASFSLRRRRRPDGARSCLAGLT